MKMENGRENTVRKILETKILETKILETKIQNGIKIKIKELIERKRKEESVI